MYDALNRLKNIKFGTSTIDYDYDNANNRTLMNSPSASVDFVYDPANRLTDKKETISGKVYTTNFGYTANDYLEKITYPSTKRVVTYGYNDNNEVTSIIGFGGSVTSITYNKAKLPRTFTYLPSGINTSLDYNNRNHTTSISSGAVVNLGYDLYDSRGNLKTITNKLESSMNQSFDYDNLSRLTNFNGAWGIGVYGYDPTGLGNRTSKTVSGVTTTYGYDPTKNWMTSTTGGEPATYKYNNNGTLESGSWGGANYILTYDDFGNLASLKTGSTALASYGYDGDGLRVTKAANGKTTIYHYDVAGKVLSETDENGALFSDFIYLNDKLIAKVVPDPLPVPNAPSAFTALPASSNSVTLSWTDNATNETGFAIERKTGATGTYVQVATVGANVTTYVDSGITGSTTYYYRVRAVNGSLYSDYPAEASATPQTPVAPAAPGALTATTLSASSITLTWTDNASNETGFAIERKAGATGAFTQIHEVGANVTTYADTGLTASTTYYYRIRAVNGTLYSAYSVEVSAATPTALSAPTAPSALTATALSTTGTLLSWVDNATNETGFTIERKTGITDTYAQIAAVGANVTTFADAGLAASTTYYYKVRAVNSGLYSAYTTEASVTTQTLTAPAAPSAPVATSSSTSSVTIAWTDNANNETGFTIERKMGATGTFAQVATVGANVTTYTDTGLAASTNYYYRLRAVNVSLYSGYSAEVVATTLTAPTAPEVPSAVTATAPVTTSVTLNWSDNATNETGFAIERKTGATGTYAQIATVGANVTTYADTGLAASTTYYYRMRAVNGTLYSAYTAEASATTQTPTAPAAPSALTLGAPSSTSVYLSWTDNATNETGFSIERRMGGTGTYIAVAAVGENATTYTDSNLSASTTYYYRVRAMNGSLYSAYTTEVSATMSSLPAPSLAVSVVKSVSVTFIITDNSLNESGFFLERKTGATGTYTSIKSIPANATSSATFQDFTAIPGTTYYYRVRGYSGPTSAPLSYSAYSNEVSASTSPLPAPSLAASALSAAKIRISLTDTNHEATGYFIERKVGATGTYAPYGTIQPLFSSASPNTLTFEDSSVSPSTLYYYRIRGYTGPTSSPLGYSAYSAEAGATTPLLPAPSLAASALSAAKIRISLTDTNHGATGYFIERKVGATGTYAPYGTIQPLFSSASPNTLTFEDSSVSPSTLYYYRIRGYTGPTSSPFGYSAYSAEAGATTPLLPAPSLAVSVVNAANITFSLTDTNHEAVGYFMERKVGLAGTYIPIYTIPPDFSSTNPNTRTVMDPSVSPSTTYYYRIRGYTGPTSSPLGFSAYSAEVNVSTPPQFTPDTPLGLIVNSSTSSGIKLTWTDASTNETGFAVERKAGVGGSYIQITTLSISTSGTSLINFTDINVTPGTTYYYRVRAYNGTLYSNYSNEVTSSIVMQKLTVQKSGSGTGIVTSNIAGIYCGSICSSTYDNGIAVKFTATAESGSTFSGWSGGGCSGTGACTVTLNADAAVTATFNMLAPTASFSATPTTGVDPVAVSFTDLSQWANAWQWDFGDGTTSNLQNPTHIYRQPGAYTVGLTVSNPAGSNASVKTNYVTVTACLNPNVRIVGDPRAFSTLQAAYDAASDGAIIQSLAKEFLESLTANRPISVTLDGGYTCDYSSNPEKTIIKGMPAINSGTVTMKNFHIQQ